MVAFQHEWTDLAAAPELAPVKMQPLTDAKAAVKSMLKRNTVRQVLEERGALAYWTQFVDNFFGDRYVYGDGSAYFRSVLRKLRRASTKTSKPPVEPAVAVKPFEPVRQRIRDTIPSSYMPSSVPPQARSLVAVYLSENRVRELGLDGFRHFEPLIA